MIFPKAHVQGVRERVRRGDRGRRSGAADAAIFSEFSAGSILGKNPTLRTLGGPPLFVDANTYFMPTGDEKLYHWVTNWLRYQSTHQTMAGALEEVGRARPRGSTTSQTQLVGTNGAAVPFKA